MTSLTRLNKLPPDQCTHSTKSQNELLLPYAALNTHFTNRHANARRIQYRLERHDNATASKVYVAVTLHDRLVGDRAA